MTGLPHGLRAALAKSSAPRSVARRALAQAVDAAAEATVVPSFSRLGVALRRRLEAWDEPPTIAGRVGGGDGGHLRDRAGGGYGPGETGCHRAPRGSRRRPSGASGALVGAAGPGPVHLDLVNMADPDAVAAFGSRLSERYERVAALIHNAGALTRTYQAALGGVEVTVATQILGRTCSRRHWLACCGAVRQPQS